ncbi:pyrroline-5-carboxylate reductase [Vibrio superstes]|uniref:Pyrroline-5-carboxylate reductase n=1 Tax=Vibrio superstes NBRC 103154 TaxID=1219062 RepID=A0A511QX10_9VIBR|nr:pyrroline-5-carboxylate reductase [Vibrio superstes]GEM81042.1 pyrroline-5-carboxylate reductase [Vibrio superstes NBRC 103154]
MANSARNIAFIGSGNMASSIIAGLLDSGYPANALTTTAPSQQSRDRISKRFSITATSDNRAAVTQADVIVLSVKPQIMSEVLAELSGIDFSNKLLISIAAGITVPRLQSMLGQDADFVRVMPNTPSLLGLGMSGLYAPQQISEKDKAFAGELMQAVGKICWVESESKINSIIAAAGSSPAYFFLFMEAMQQEAIAQGFDKDTARMLVQQSAIGAAQMVAENPELELATLRQQVTSKGGTTAEAIATFNQHQLSDTVATAMQAAVKRAQEMESLF